MLRSWQSANSASVQHIAREQERALKGARSAFSKALPVAALGMDRFVAIITKEYWSAAPEIVRLDDLCRKAKWHPAMVDYLHDVAWSRGADWPRWQNVFR